jgi:hypothetical protein
MTTPHKLVNGQVVPLSAEEIAQRQAEETAWNNGAFDRAIADLRSKRDRLLASCDYTVLQDSTYTDAQVAEWVTYRQALRDITNGLTTVADVEAVVFPTKP